jgi:hypothetical protein
VFTRGNTSTAQITPARETRAHYHHPPTARRYTQCDLILQFTFNERLFNIHCRVRACIFAALRVSSARHQRIVTQNQKELIKSTKGK